MADRSTQMLLDGLSRAAADPAGLPLLAGKAFPGLYPCTAPGKQVAQRCKEEGFLRVVRTETRGKNAVEVCTISDKGIAYLLSRLARSRSWRISFAFWRRGMNKPGSC